METNTIKDKILPILKRNNVIKALLFGSYAAGTATKRSDIDIMIIMNTEKRFFDRFDQFNDLYDSLKGFAVELLIYTPEELEQISHRKFIQSILNKGRILYEC